MNFFSSGLKGAAALACLIAFTVTATLAFGLIVGFILSYFVPAIDFGTATICGLLTVAIVVYTTVQISKLIHALNLVVQSKMDDDDEGYEDGGLLTADQVEMVSEQLADAIMMRMSFPDGRSKRNSGRGR